MKKISYILAVFSMLLFLAACKKEKNEESTWYIDGVKYSTRNADRHTSYDPPSNSYSTALICKTPRTDNYSDGVDLAFAGTGLPQTGTFSIKTYQDTNRDGLVILHYNHYSYYCSVHNNGTIIASMYKGLAKYEIAPVWFKSGDDSVLFSGTFYEPIKKQ